MCQLSAFIPWNNTEIQTNSFLLHSNKIGNNCFSSQINSPTCGPYSILAVSSEVWSIVYRTFPKTCKYISTLKPLWFTLQHPCLLSTMSFLPFTVQSLERDFCIPNLFSFVLSLLQLSFYWKTQIMIFVLLKVNRHFSVIISLGRHFLATALMDSPYFSKLHFPALSGHQSILICHVPLWTTIEVSLILFSTGLHISLEKEMATHSRILAWRIPGTAEPGGLPSMESHRVGQDWSNLAAASHQCLSSLEIFFSFYSLVRFALGVCLSEIAFILKSSIVSICQ